VEDKEIHVIFW